MSSLHLPVKPRCSNLLHRCSFKVEVLARLTILAIALKCTSLFGRNTLAYFVTSSKKINKIFKTIAYLTVDYYHHNIQKSVKLPLYSGSSDGPL
jgi:hypothetical protein